MSNDQKDLEKLFSIVLGLAIIGLGFLYLKKSGQLDTIREGLSVLRNGGNP